MTVSVTTGARRRSAVLIATYKVAAETESRLELHAKRIAALLAAAFLSVFGSIFSGAAWHFYSPYRTPPQVLIVGGLGLLLLVLALMMLYFGLRRPDRIVVDATRREIRFERRRQPMRIEFDRVTAVKVETEDRSRARTRLIVHPVVLEIDDGSSVEVDAASDVEEMIPLAAKLRSLLDKPLAAGE